MKTYAKIVSTVVAISATGPALANEPSTKELLAIIQRLENRISKLEGERGAATDQLNQARRQIRQLSERDDPLRANARAEVPNRSFASAPAAKSGWHGFYAGATLSGNTARGNGSAARSAYSTSTGFPGETTTTTINGSIDGNFGMSVQLAPNERNDCRATS